VETGARGGAAWPARGGREGRWHGAQLQLARLEPTVARSERRPCARAQGKMDDGPAVRVGLGRYCRTGLSPSPN
jgi:hypothetical protein